MTGAFFDVVIAVFNAITSFITADYFFSLFAMKNNRYAVWRAIAFAAFVAAPLMLKMTLGNMFILVVCVFVISLNFNFKTYNKLLFTILLVTINVLSEIIVTLLLSIMTGTDSVTVTTGMYLALGALLSKFVCIVLCYIIGIIKKEILVGRFSLRWLSLYSLPVATYIITFAIYRSSFYFADDSFIQKLSLTGIALLIISNLLIIKLVNNIHDSVVNEQRLKTAEELVKQQQKQFSLMLENNEKTAKQRHDYKNFVIGLLSEFNSGEYEKIKGRLQGELEELNDVSNKVSSGNDVVDTIIGYKMSEARNVGVAIDFDYRNISGINISGVDLSILLGNAIDNALEAAARLKDDWGKNVNVFMVVNNDRVIITVTNNVDENIDVNCLKSTKSDSQSHGFGIINMHSIASKYNGEVVFECEDNVFKTIVMVDNIMM